MGVLAILVNSIVSIYNGLIRLKNDINKNWSNIDVLLKQRNDEIPNLLATVKGYMEHERSLLEDITNARAQMLSAKDMKGMASADQMITGGLKSLFAVAENYPDLKANESFLKLQLRITGLENEIADRRELYNNAVNLYHIRIESFPDVLMAKLMGLKRRQFFRVLDSEKEVVDVTV